MPGEGLEPSCGQKPTPDFKSGAYVQFRHPGAARIAAPGRLQTAEVVGRRDRLRALLADHERDLLVGLQHEAGRVPGVVEPVHVHTPRRLRLAVAADALVRQAQAPDAEEVAEGEGALRR